MTRRTAQERFTRPALVACAAALALAACAQSCVAALPREIERMFADAKVPLNSIGVVVQEVNARRPLFGK